jgi:hypothetical protein
MKKAVIALAATAGLLVAGGAAAIPASASQSTVMQTAARDYTTKQKNQLWNAVRRDNPTDARIIGKTDIVGLAVVTCDLLRAGADLNDLAELVVEADPIIEDIITTVFAFSTIYLCKDQQYKFD